VFSTKCGNNVCPTSVCLLLLLCLQLSEFPVSKAMAIPARSATPRQPVCTPPLTAAAALAGLVGAPLTPPLTQWPPSTHRAGHSRATHAAWCRRFPQAKRMPQATTALPKQTTALSLLQIGRPLALARPTSSRRAPSPQPQVNGIRSRTVGARIEVNPAFPKVPL
jgi:hypothetical protein